MECASMADLGFNPDATTESQDDPSTNGQANARPGILFLRMQAKEDLKDPFVVPCIDASRRASV